MDEELIRASVGIDDQIAIDDQVSAMPRRPIIDPPPPPPIPESAPDFTAPTLTFLEPEEGSKREAGQPVLFRFKASDLESGIRSVEWSVDGARYEPATWDTGAVWKTSLPLPQRGSRTVWVRATDESTDVAGGNVTVGTRSVVAYDATAPGLTVEAPKPAQGQSVAEVTEAVVRLEVKASDADPGSGVKSVTWSLDGVNFKDAARAGADSTDGTSSWTASIPVPSTPPGFVPKGGTSHTLTVRAYNLDGYFREKTVSVRAVDGTAPHLQVTEPRADRTEIPGTAAGATVPLKGTASDTHDGTKLYSGVDRVEWSLDDGAWQTAVPGAPGDWSSWSASVPIPAHDEHKITVRCSDKQGILTVVERVVVAALPFEVKDLSARSYLKDLIDFATRRLKQSATGTYLDPLLLATTFHQPFAGLVATTGDRPVQPVPQVRVVTEVLRQYLNPRPVAHWAFDEGSGNVAVDSSGNGNAGTLKGPSRIAGKTGGALGFDGVDDVVELPGTGARDILNAFTIAFWANPQATIAIDPQASSGIGQWRAQRFAISAPQGGRRYQSPEHACAGVSVGTNGISVYEHSDEYMPALLVHAAPISGWTHIAVVYDDRTPRLYLNGVLQKIGFTGPKPCVHINPSHLGAGGDYGYFKGGLDDVRIYDRPLTAAEVHDLLQERDNRLVGHWRFEEGSGTVAIDSTGKGNNGILHGPSWTEGRRGPGSRALSFDGVDDYVSMGASPGLVMREAVTIAAWIYPTGTGGIGPIVNKEGEYEIKRYPDGTIWWSFANANPGWGGINSGHVAPKDVWTHVAVVYDGTIIRTYVNGKEVHNRPGSGVIGDVAPTGNQFRIGGREHVPTEHFAGRIDDVRIYDRPLNAAEVQDLLQERDNRLAGYWRFEEGSGTVAIDATGMGNHGVLHGSSWTEGRFGPGSHALSFDGVDDYVLMGAPPSLVMRDALTIAAWIYPTGPGGGGVFVNKEGEYQIAWAADGTIRWGIANSDPGWIWINTGHIVPKNMWTHLAVIYDGTAIRTYANGKEVHNRPGTGVIGDANRLNNEFRIGGRQQYQHNFAGRIDDVRIYDRALSAAEVSDLVNATAAEIVWVEDMYPAGATAHATEDGWYWVGANPAPFTGGLALQSTVAAGMHQHFFTGATAGLPVSRGDRLFAHVYLDPTNVPDTVMLQWNDGTWEHRAYWGKSLSTWGIGGWGIEGATSLRAMGALPPAGLWVRLEVPASLVGLENRMVTGMAFTLHGGRATWDRAGKVVYAGLAAAEAEYRRAAYLTLLNNLGTSYEAIRLARGADASTRMALAERLGIQLGPTRPDVLDRLFLPAEHVTEADLEGLFGLEVTTSNPLDEAAPPEPELLAWQRDRLRTAWETQDAVTEVPIVDPDLVERDDLRTHRTGDPAFDLWTARQSWVTARLSELRTKRESKSTHLAGLDFVVNDLLTPHTLADLGEDRQKGVDVAATLKEKGFTVAGFDYLVRVRRLAAAASVLPNEWEDVYSILAQVLKVRSYPVWRDEERTRNLHLGPDAFKSPNGSATSLPSWRATEQARRPWQRRLQARFDQSRAAATTLDAAVRATEEATLPLLRDALVAAIGEGRPAIDVAEALTRRLVIDGKSSGSLRTTRVAQAIETLQGILFALRSGHFKERTAELGLNPASTWVLEQRTGYKEEQFDLESRWMGSFDTWRAAMFAFLYPENLLFPSLREDRTPGSTEKDPTVAFKTLVERLRSKPGLTPGQARDEASKYLTSLLDDLTVKTLADELAKPPPGSPPGSTTPFAITEQLDEAQLLARRGWLANLCDPVKRPDLTSAQTQTYLREVFYFVPVQLALQLQQSGEYLAALDWWQTVYAYNLPPEQRKIYEPLKLDPQTPEPIDRPIQWLLNSLNPHFVAATRANAYTRFTLLSLARCFLDYADAEFTHDTTESIPRARALYMTVLALLDSPQMRQAADGTVGGAFPPNPVPPSLRLRAELGLFKLRSGRNFAGLQRQVEPVAANGTVTTVLPAASSDGRLVPVRTTPLRPTPYYYRVLIERAKQLVAIAQQVEAAYLAALERTDGENFSRLEAGHALDLSQANVDLQRLREREAVDGEELANRQQARAETEETTYERWIEAGPNRFEEALVKDYKDIRTYRDWVAGLDAAIATANAVGENLAVALVVGGLSVTRAGFTAGLHNVEMQSQVNQLRASQELRTQEWELRKAVATKERLIADQQVQLAKDHILVARQEFDIAWAQSDQAKIVADFLANKFTNAELYEWMSGVLGQVYGYFLRQSTAVAQLAQNQLAFERQETPPAFVQADYWQAPSDRSPNGSAEGDEPDRRGLTGSARLLQDVYRLDQYAFETDKRKLQLTHTISLAQAYPFEFQSLRETGVLTFRTPMEMFDRAFPGHYMRLIHRVRTSVVALVPPTAGIRATLSASGLSQVVTGDGFQPVEVRRNPEVVALSSPMNATGLFELDPQSEMMAPFERMGVDTSWRLELPKASNPFDYRTIADVLVTIEYTALGSDDYRRQVIASLDGKVSADRSFSLRDQFTDQWYDLLNPAQSATPMTVRFAITRDDFPPNVDGVTIEHLVLCFVRNSGVTSEITVKYLHLQGTSKVEEGGATSANGFINTRTSSGADWDWTGVSPVGEWELAFDDQARPLFEGGQIEDILFVVTYGGESPKWPT